MPISKGVTTRGRPNQSEPDDLLMPRMADPFQVRDPQIRAQSALVGPDHFPFNIDIDNFPQFFE
jgi:hypothetical protein